MSTTSAHESAGSAAASRPRDSITYEEFGAAFFEHAVTEERILGVVAGMLDRPIDVGPMGAGPGRLATVSASGTYGTPTMQRIGERPVAYRLTIRAGVDVHLDLQVETHRFHADLEVPLTLHATAASPLSVVIEILPPHADDLTVRVRAEGLRASVIRKVAAVDHELRRFLAKYVARELQKPYVEGARTIDIAGLMDQAWAGIRERR